MTKNNTQHPAATPPLGAAVLHAVKDEVDVKITVAEIVADLLAKTSNLSDLANVAMARSNLGLGTAATTSTTAYDAAGTAAGLVAGKVDKTTLNANTVLYATTDDTPAALAMGAATILARLAAGNIVAATPAQIKALLAIAIADVSSLQAALDAKLSGVRVEDEGTPTVPVATALNFAGSGVTVTDAGSGEATVTIPGGGIGGVRVEDEGTAVVAAATGVNFAGSGVTVADAGSSEALVTIPGGITGVRVEDEGTSIVAAATGINFVGQGVTVTNAGSNEATVTVGPLAIADTSGLQAALDAKLVAPITELDVDPVNVDGVAALASMRTLGTGAQQAMAGDAVISPGLIMPAAAQFVAIAAAAASPVADFYWGVRFSIPRAKAYRWFLTRIGTSSGNVEFAVCRWDGANLTKLMTSGVIACPAAGDIRRDLGSTVLPAGEYGLFMWLSAGAAVSIPHAVDANYAALRQTVTGIAGALPTTLSNWGTDRTAFMALESA